MVNSSLSVEKILQLDRRYYLIMVSGGILGLCAQLLAIKYLKKHPELKKRSKKPTRKLPRIKINYRDFLNYITSLRGGEIASILSTILPILAENGTICGLGGGYLLYFLSLNNLQRWYLFYNAVPGNPALLGPALLDAEDLLNLKYPFPLVCDSVYETLFMILKDEHLSEKMKVSELKRIFKFYPLKTHSERLNFLICMVAILSVLVGIPNCGGFLLLTKRIIALFRSGRISKAMLRALIRQMRRKGIPVDPELERLVAEMI